MDANKLLMLEERVSRIEKAFAKKNKEKESVNEAIPAILSKVAPVLLKNLPLILDVLSNELPKELPKLVDALKSDTVNDNSEKIKALTELQEVGKKVADLFANDSK